MTWSYVPRSYLSERLRARMRPMPDGMPQPVLHQTALVYHDDGCGGYHSLHMLGPRVYHDVEVVDSHSGPGIRGFASPSRDAKGLHIFKADRKNAHNGCTAVLWSGWVTGDEPVLLGGDGSPTHSALWRWWDGKLRGFWHWYYRHVTRKLRERQDRRLSARMASE